MLARNDHFAQPRRRQPTQQGLQTRAEPLSEERADSLRRLQWLIGAALALLVLNAALVVALTP